MRNRLQFSVVLTAVLGFGLQSQAGDLPAPGTVTLGSSGVSVNGLVDTYINYNFNEPAHSNNTAASPQNRFRYNDRASRQFDIYEATVGLHKDADPVGFDFKIGQGTRYKVMNSGEASTGFEYVRDANVSWESGKFSMLLGRFDSGFGMENGTSVNNWNYSRGTSFTLLTPEFYTGVKFGYNFGSGVTFGIGVVNGANRFADNNVGKTVPIWLMWENDDTSVAFNGVMGSEQDASSRALRRTLGFTAKHQYSKMFGVGLDGTWRNEKDAVVAPATSTLPASKKKADAYGAGLYVNTSFWDNVQDNFRADWMRDNDGAVTGTARNLTSFTLTHRCMHSKNLNFWAELRYDTSEINSFMNDKGLTVEKNQFTGTLAATLQI